MGYGGDTLEGLVARLHAAQVTHVADVRSKPYSRFRPEFNGPELQNALKLANIGYVFLGRQLGGRPDDPDCYTTDDRVDYAMVRQKSFFREGLDRVQHGVSRGYRLCLLCSEGRPESCHRTKLIAEALLDEAAMQVIHVEPDGSQSSHAEVLARLTGGQQSLGFIDVIGQSLGAYASDGGRK